MNPARLAKSGVANGTGQNRKPQLSDRRESERVRILAKRTLAVRQGQRPLVLLTFTLFMLFLLY